ncbi:MAG: Ig-like domain repeat protein, partial [Methanosphaera sp.]|nr:Ig-like domain repeat protein [Methanosphaera sp.]
MASATEVKDVNNMQEIMDDIKLSTPDNHDVDKVVQSSTSQSSTDAEVKNYNTSDKTNYSEISEITNRQTENAIKTNEFNITSKNTNLNKNIQQKVKSEGEGSFTELQRLINENSVIDLGQNYQFISGTDDDELVDGIVINKDLTIYGNGFTIDAKNSARIFKISGTDINVELINIKLINANSTLRDNDGNGGAIYTDSHLTIQDCTFTNNGANNGGAVFATKQSDAEYVDSLTIDNCNFTENIALVNGGAINIFEESDNVKMLNSNFTNNRVIGYNNSDNSRWYGDGGAICFNKTSTNALIDNSIFINNTVNANGGAIMWKGEYGNITNSKFYNNSAPYAAGALRLDGSHVVVNNTLFDGNYDSKGNYSWGSAIYLTGNYTNITYSNFTNNYNSNNGTIAISGSNEMLENNIFINNSAYNGGAVYIRKNENVTFDYNTFTKNNAGNNGGAVFISDHANNTKILNSIFTDNKAIGYNISATNWIGNGGAVFFDTGCHEGLIDNSTFTNNSANANGGAVVWNGNDGNITSSKFYNNSAPYAGGALRLSGNRLLVNDSVFEGNYDPVGSYSWGSAVYISGNFCNITYSNFTNNYGGETAGAIYVAGTNATVKYSLFENNSANDKGGAINIRGNNAILFNNNITANKVTAGDGGAVYIQGANTTIEYCNIANNNATVHGGAVYSNGNNLTMDYCNLTSNSVCNVTLNTLSQGGAMYLASSHNARVNYCNFTSNYASNAGGAMFWVSSNNIIMNNSYFFNCSCGITNGSKATSPADHGGAINFNSNKNNTVNNCTFDSCFSEKDGGAIFYAASDSSGSVISNSTFINCYSVFRSAGAVAWKEKNGQILDTKFINCYSLSGDSPTFSGKGGAMYFEKAKNNILLNVSFINCSALYEGAAIYYRNTDNDPSSNNTHINCTFINNNVTRNGGALAFASANETYDGCIFVNNSASNGGSICYSVNGGIIIRNSIFVNNTNITNGGFIYINGSKVEITNNTFNNGSAENGGAIYVNTAVTINDSSFTNNTAENGGALYITKDTTLNNCNVTNNNATKGSGIYVNSGKLTLKTVKLIENQAHSKEFADISDNVIGDKRSISGVFTGWDNYLNGIYVVTDNVVFEDVLYLGIDNLGTVAIVNTDETSATIHNLLNESAQLIYLDIYGRDGSVQTLQNYTDEYGNFKFEFDNNADDSYKIYHLEDNYYTELVYTFNKNLVNITLNVTNITYGNSESIKINVTGNASDIPTGTVLVYLNSTLDGFTNRTYEATLEDGFVSIDDAPLDLLNVSTYDVYVRYIGDEHYLSGNATATFVVSNAKPSLNIGISDYTYNETKTIIFDLIGINDEPITGKVIFNITGTESDGTPYSLTDIEINITRDEHGVIVNNTYELPVLNATGVDNNYEIVAFSPESTNYNSTNNSTTFKVFKAQPVINVTAYNITTDGMFAVDVHVEPEIANGTVNLFINTTEGKEYVLTLDDSRASIDLDKLPRGNYTATATYNGDKNHNYPVSNSTKFEVLYDDFPIDIQLRNMTYGETQIISISVPKDYEGTLKIKFNGTELTEEYYTIEDGVIYIDTGDLTNIIEDGILIVGEYNLSVNYTPAENDYYRANCTDKLFNVTRADPNIIISTEEIGYLSNETITINLTSYNATGKINITVVNITEEGSTYTNYSVDIKNDTVVTVTIPDLEIGTYNVIVEYCNDTNYNNKTFTETFKVLPLVISITLNRPEIYVDEFETIFGSVTDISGRKVTTGKVNVTISNESGYITSYLVDVDSESGLYFTTNRYNIEGTLYANATYILGDKIIANSTTKSFVVSKIPTITNVTVVNSTVGKVTIDVSVRENATPTATSSGYTNPITEGKLNVTVNGESKLFDITGSTTPIVLDVDPVNINTTETVDFTVEYIGDYKHNSSFGVNNTTGEKITEFTASPIGSNLTINVVPNPVQTGENVTISGQVFDDLGNLIKSGKVNVSIDGVFQGEYDINETTGYYTLNYTTSTVKDVNVEVNFTGIKTEDDSRYMVSTSSNVTTFTVEKIPTITNVTVTNHTVGNVTLKITVEDENGNIIKDGKVHITIAGNDPIEVELSGEDYTVVYLLDNMTSVGNISVTVEYTGNDTYLPSVANNTDDNKVLKNITVTPHNSSITVDVIPKNTTIGENVTISGQLVDEMSNNISNADLVIYVDGVGFAAKTNATGGYSFNYTTTRVADDIVVNATFDGGDNYNSTSANTTFNVTKIVTKTNVTIVNTTIGNVVIHVKVTNLTDYPVERGHVVVCNQTGQIVGEGELVNGGVDITLNVTTVG